MSTTKSLADLINQRNKAEERASDANLAVQNRLASLLQGWLKKHPEYKAGNSYTVRVHSAPGRKAYDTQGKIVSCQVYADGDVSITYRFTTPKGTTVTRTKVIGEL